MTHSTPHKCPVCDGNRTRLTTAAMMRVDYSVVAPMLTHSAQCPYCGQTHLSHTPITHLFCRECAAPSTDTRKFNAKWLARYRRAYANSNHCHNRRVGKWWEEASRIKRTRMTAPNGPAL